MTADRGLERLYREEGARLWRALVAFSRDREVASDAVAEAFAQALARGDELRDPRRWVWRAAFRIAAGELKDRLRFQPPDTDRGLDMEEPPARLVADLAAVSPNQRAALALHYYGGYSTKEIAGIIGSSAATVRVHLSQGRRRLRRILEEHDVTDLEERFRTLDRLDAPDLWPRPRGRQDNDFRVRERGVRASA